jgi:hypothetical protein
MLHSLVPVVLVIMVFPAFLVAKIVGALMT